MVNELKIITKWIKLTCKPGYNFKSTLKYICKENI